jgi:hypothetical protein
MAPSLVIRTIQSEAAAEWRHLGRIRLFCAMAPALAVFMQAVCWAALIKVGLVTGAALGAASQYLVNG